MKIATSCFLATFTALILLPSSGAWAQDLASPPPATAVTLPAVMPVSSGSAGSAQPSLPAAVIPDTSSVDEGDDSPKIPASVKEAVKKLSNSAKGANIEDMNAAREASAKLDLLLDIEKKLQELDKIRNERGEASGIAAAIPASALGAGRQAPQAMPMMPQPMPTAMPIMTPSTDPEIVKIAGAGGHYVAFIKEGEGANPKIIREGETTPDGSLVKAISRYGVTLKRGQKTTTVQVKDVSNVFGSK